MSQYINLFSTRNQWNFISPASRSKQDFFFPALNICSKQTRVDTAKEVFESFSEVARSFSFYSHSTSKYLLRINKLVKLISECFENFFRKVVFICVWELATVLKLPGKIVNLEMGKFAVKCNKLEEFLLKLMWVGLRKKNVDEIKIVWWKSKVFLVLSSDTVRESLETILMSIISRFYLISCKFFSVNTFNLCWIFITSFSLIEKQINTSSNSLEFFEIFSSLICRPKQVFIRNFKV